MEGEICKVYSMRWYVQDEQSLLLSAAAKAVNGCLWFKTFLWPSLQPLNPHIIIIIKPPSSYSTPTFFLHLYYSIYGFGFLFRDQFLQQAVRVSGLSDMTMVPAENLSKQQHLHQEECFGLLMSRIELQGHEFYCTSSNCLLGSDNLGAMAEDESRSNSLSEAGSSSKAECERSDVEGSWLQLGIGNSKNINPPIATADEQRRLVELDLLPAATQLAIRSSSAAPMFHVPADQIPILTPIPHPHPLPPPARPFPNFTPSSLYFPSASPPHHHRHHQEVNWAFNIGTASTSSSSSSLMPQIGGSSYFARQFHQLQSPMDVSAVGPPSLDFRVVNPPRRPHSGIWFMLQASQNQ